MSVWLVVVHVKATGVAILTLGGVAVCVTVVDVEAVHPFAGSVAVTVYVPAVVTDLVLPVPPPLHAKVAPAVVEDAVNVVLVTVQFSTAGGAILTLGVVVFCVTVVEAEAVQPFAGSVAETVYVPAVETLFVLPVPPPLHANVAPAVVEDAFNVTELLMQFNCAGAAILTLGAVIFCVTVLDAEAVHPFAGSVAVTVYVPAVLTDFVLPVPPPLHAKVAPAVVEEAVNV